MPEGNVHPLRPQPETEPPPHNIEVEQSLLGALMQRNAGMAQVAATLQAEHFFHADHQRIFRVISSFIEQGIDATPMTVKTDLPPQLAGVATFEYLVSLFTSATTTNAAGYATIVRSLHTRRVLKALGEDMAERAQSDPIEATGLALVDDVESQLLQIRDDMPATEKTRQTAPQAASWMLDRVTGLREGTIKSTAISTGIADLDRVTNGGFQRGEFWLLGGRPGMGKTIALTSLSRLASRSAPVLVNQYEVTRDQMMARFLADLACDPRNPLPFGRIMAGEGLDEEDFWRVREAAERFGKLNITVEVEAGASLPQVVFAVKAERKRWAAQGLELGTVFLDHLDFIQASDRYKGQRVLEIGEIAGALKRLAKAENVCIVLLTQLSRQVEARERTDKRPQLSDLRNSGDLEQYADRVIFVYREAYYLEQQIKASPDDSLVERLERCQNAMELLVRKNRAGPACTVEVWCDPASSAISQYARGVR